MLRFINILFQIIKYLFEINITRLLKKGVSRVNIKYSQKIVDILKIKIDIKGLNNLKGSKYIVSNHLSYLDIIVLNSQLNLQFISSLDMGSSGVIGMILRSANVLLVNRKSIYSIKNDLLKLKNFENGEQILLFAEGTSSNGNTVLPFKSSLFESMINDEYLDLVTINYKTLNGFNIDNTNRDYIFWYGDMTFFNHLYRLCANIKTGIEVDLIFDNLKIDNYNRKEIANRTRNIILNNYKTL